MRNILIPEPREPMNTHDVPVHTKDEDCTIDPDTLICVHCGVDHSGECPLCGGHGFHKGTCERCEKETNI